MKNLDDISGHKYAGVSHSPSHAYLLPAVKFELAALKPKLDTQRLFDLGCGNGSTASVLHADGWDVTGVDPSTDGIAQANRHFPDLRLEIGSAYEDLAARFGRFPPAISLEVVEHVYSPHDYTKTLFDLLEPGGTAIVSTPYHGYVKNVVLAVSGKMDNHLMPLKEHGHIKFWSMPTLTRLLVDTGFRDIRFLRVGRVPILAKSMIAVAKRPA